MATREGESATFFCLACRRQFKATQEEIEAAAGHLCLAMDRGLSQQEALQEMRGRARWIIVGRMGAVGLALWPYLHPYRFRMERENLQGSPRVRFDGNCPDCVRGGIFARISARKSALMGAGNAVTQPLAKWIGQRIIEANEN